jgi:hypothetical protein
MEPRPPPPKSTAEALEASIATTKRAGRDVLISSLQWAAQIEHDLMVQYLYAAYSLDVEQVQVKEHQDFVRACRETLLAVAREEMGHLLTVQNVLLLVGGPVHFERETWRPERQPVEFKLEPLSFKSLFKYLVGEASATFRLQHLDVAKPAGIIGGTYKIIIGHLNDVDAVPDSMFDPSSHPYQATWDEFGRGYGPRNAKPYALETDVSADEQRGLVMVNALTTRTQVISALRDIAGQGEQPETGDSLLGLSHFKRFDKLVEEFKKIRTKEPNWSPSLPVATDPWTERSATEDRASGTEIPLGAARYWADLFNLRYRMLLSLFTYLFRVPRGESRPPGGVGRAEIIGRLFGEMYNMKAVAGILVRMPIKEDKDGRVTMAGPPFQVPYTLGQPISSASFWRMHLDLLTQAAKLAELLLSDYHGSSPAAGERYLHLMVEADLQTRRWVEKVLAGEGALP